MDDCNLANQVTGQITVTGITVDRNIFKIICRETRGNTITYMTYTTTNITNKYKMVQHHG